MDVTNKTGSVAMGALAGILFGGAVGLFNGIVVTRLKVNSLIATIATMMILQGGVFLYTREAVQNRHQQRGFTEISTGYIGPIPIPVIIAAAIIVLAYIVLRHTTLGRYIYAVGANERAARLSGLRPERLKLLVFVVTGLLTGLAGLILASLMNTGQPTAGRGFELTVVAAVILGGTSLTGGRGTLIGTLLGRSGAEGDRQRHHHPALGPEPADDRSGHSHRRCDLSRSCAEDVRCTLTSPWKSRRKPRRSVPALEMVGIGKRFPGVLALENVDLRLEPGKVHALMGENGAGKSTLIKILAGVYQKDAGTIRIGGVEAQLRTPRDALKEGHQGGVPGDRPDLRIHRGREHLPRGVSGQQGRLHPLEHDTQGSRRPVRARRLQCRSRREGRQPAAQPAADGGDCARACP